ncbi:MAG: hypothetical protein Q4C96_03200 [Planctomycetia bacterium]|nr:hypothetical protein [Planctomycetia bacterium]
MPSNERGKEIKRRRHRKEKFTQLQNRLKKETISREVAAEKLRKLTTGAETVIENWGLES